MKRIFQRKARLACPKSDAATASNRDECISSDSSVTSRKSVTMLGIALSVAASGLVIPQQDDRALAADQPVSEQSFVNARSASESTQPSVVAADRQKVNHVVREGDTLWGLADQYRVSTDEIVSSNILNSDEVLRVGQAIDIPVESQPSPQVPSPVEVDSLSSEAASRNLAYLQVQKASESMGTVAAEDAAALDSEDSRTRVSRSGAVSRQPIDRLRSRREDLQDGVATLQLNKPASSTSSQSGNNFSDRPDASGQSEFSAQTGAPPQQPVALVETGDLNVPTVQRQTQSGETVESIALAYAVDLQVIVELNQLANPDEIQAGQPLLLPADDLAEAQLPPSNAVVADARQSSGVDVSVAEDEPLQVSALRQNNSPELEVSDVSQPATHQIRPGETLAEIAERYGVTLQELIESNSVRNPNRVFAGRVLNIPASHKATVEPASPQASLGLTEETLLGYVTLPGAEFGVTDAPDLVSAPVVSLPSAVDAEALDIQESVEDPEPNRVATSSDALTLVESSEETDNSVYVEGLRDDILAIENTSDSSVSRLASEGALGVTASVAPDAVYLQEGNAVNSEFEQSVSFRDRTNSSSEIASVPAQSTPSTPARPAPSQSETPSGVVATAPVGSENYAPLGQPATGRVVSPDLPPLPGPENYIPSGSPTFNGYLWPARGVFTSGYGWRWGRMHRGIDIAAPVGTPIYAAAPGVIEFSGWNSGGYGNLVDIRHPDGSKTRYAHNSRILVRSGQSVTQGQQIAEMGSTGYSTGPHVHFEIHVPNQGAVNPVALLPAR
ncbi:MAG: LysM peptidoglycan-binding domain-containing protein [Elainellaceae cyanobacterium]